MSFLANQQLRETLPEILGTDFVLGNIKNASYELLLGNEIYSNSDSVKTILDENSPQFELKPGQFALLITKEKLNIPAHFIGFISLKFGFKKKGLVNISGFHVDPGFKGKLKFSVYNAGSRSILLQKDKPYFVLWLSQLTSELSSDEKYGSQDEHQNQHEITPDDIMNINGEIASPNGLLEKLKSIESRLETEREWRRWGTRIIIGLLVAVGIKLFYDWNSYREGYTDAYNLMNEKNISSTNLNDRISEETTKRVQEILPQKIDSLIKLNNESLENKEE